MFCSNCGKEMSTDKKFCSFCGSKNPNYESTDIVSSIASNFQVSQQTNTIFNRNVLTNYCGKCGTQLKDNISFCPSCGDKLFTEEAPIAKNKSNFMLKIILIFCFVILIVGIILGTLWFVDKNDKTNDSNSSESTIGTSETVARDEKTEYIDYYSHLNEWSNEYGLSDLKSFTYCINKNYQNVASEHLGVISAIEYDCDKDGTNELITLSLLPTYDNKLYISPSIITNKNEIKKVSLTNCSDNKLVSECPILDVGNVDGYKGSYISVRAFVAKDKLCILYGMYSSAEIGRGELYDNIYVYRLDKSNIELYRHYYLYEEETINNYRSYNIGETTQNLSYQFKMNYDYQNTPNWSSTNEYELNQWHEIYIKAVQEMRVDATTFGFQEHFATNEDISDSYYKYIINSRIFMDDYFKNDELLLDCFINCEDGENYVADSIIDYTKIREKFLN